ncbi:organic cation transporter-like protein [Papilio machaon]|uniref:organic cation transporter-like protein n=1 Tax=Papilio machaon TaxID=76193 RepID=UPI001E663267|nr:organic cation transporter-like protein [Papilio machaon]
MDVMKNKFSPKDKTQICDIMERLGKFQRIQYAFSFLATLLVTITHINYVFVAGELNYRCLIPECEDTYKDYSPTWWPNSTIGKCLKPILRPNVGPICTNDSFTSELEDCTEWVYETNNTVVAELKLGCQPWKVNMIGTTHSIGLLLAMIVSGWMIDRFGRKPIFIFCLVGSCIGHLKAFTSVYYIYVLIELIEAVITGGAYTAVSVLMMEIGGKKNRLLAGVIYAFGIYLGESVFAVMAMFVPYWKNLIKVIYTPPILILSYVYFLKESPRWQIVKGKTECAKKTLLLISEYNKVNINKDKLESMNEEELKIEFKIENCQQKETFRDAMKSREIIKRLVVGSFARFAACFIYYGLIINSVSLPGNKYTNFLLSSVMSYPGDLTALYLMNNVGRKLTLVYGYIVCGLLCVASVCFPDGMW